VAGEPVVDSDPEPRTVTLDSDSVAVYARRIRNAPTEHVDMLRVNRTSLYEYVGNPHVHTSYSSDRAALHGEIAQAAAEADLNFVIVTDHNIWVDGCENYYGPVLLLVGEEIHDVQRQPQGSHLLAYSVDEELAPFAHDPQRLIDEANRRGGSTFIAHPFDYESPLGRNLHARPWRDWDVKGFSGIEIWNYSSEYKGLLRSRVAAAIYSRHPAWGITGPYAATLRRWDELLALGMRVAALGGADAHGFALPLDKEGQNPLPYSLLFQCINTHILTQRPLSGVFEQDKRLVHQALREGHTWVAYDRLAPTNGFSFRARSGPNEATVGDDLKRTGAVVMQVHTPRKAEIRLVRNGRVVRRRHGDHLRYTTADAGVYRVEAYLKRHLLSRGWIFSSPIYVS
jgi:hypothetical protein